MTPTTNLLLGTSAMCLLVACGGDSAGPAPEPLETSGSYDLVSHFDVKAAAVLPAPAADALDLLAGLRDDPTGTLVALLDDAGVPIVDDLYGSLPGPLKSRLSGWINDHIHHAVFADQSVDAHLDEIFALTETTLASFDLDSQLFLGAAPAGASHRLTAIAFHVGATDVRLDLPEAASAALDVSCSASVSPDSSLSVGEHGYGLAYGEYADRAIEQVIVARYGTDLRGTFDLLFDCPALAASVASRCVLGVCVGHEAQLAELCSSGLDLAADQVHARVRALRFDALRFDAGAATFVDRAPLDGRADALVDGVWQARIDAGQGLRPVPATFVGTATR